MEANGYPVAAMVLGIVMGTMVEQSFVTSLIKSDGSLLPFFERPVSAVLASLTIGALLWPGAFLAQTQTKPGAPARQGDLSASSAVISRTSFWFALNLVTAARRQ